MSVMLTFLRVEQLQVDPSLKWFEPFHLFSRQRGLILGSFALSEGVLGNAEANQKHGKTVGDLAFINLRNTIWPGGKISIWALESTKVKSMKEIRGISAMGKIKEKSKSESVGWRLSKRAKVLRLFRHQGLKEMQQILGGVCLQCFMGDKMS